MKCVSVALLVCLIAISSVDAQNVPRERHHHIWVGYSPESINLPYRFSGKMRDVKTALIAYQFQHALFTNEHRTIFLTHQVLLGGLQQWRVGSRQQLRQSYLAAGIAPYGMNYMVTRYKKYNPSFNMSVGFLYFDQPIPDYRGRNFNFTYELGVALNVKLDGADGGFVTLGYRHHHISNAMTAVINPGYDAAMFYVAIPMK